MIGAVFLLLGLSIILLAIGWLIGGVAGISIALILAVLINISVYWYSDKIVLRAYAAQPLEDEKIKKIVENMEGFEIKDVREVQDSLLIKISCKGVLTKYNTLRIDVSLKNKILLDYSLKNYISDYIDVPPFSLKALKPEELISEKIHCLMNRKKARDLYDLFFLLKQFSFDKELVEKKLGIFKIKYSQSQIKKRIAELESLWETELKHFVLEDLPDFNIVRDYVVKKLSSS